MAMQNKSTSSNTTTWICNMVSSKGVYLQNAKAKTAVFNGFKSSNFAWNHDKIIFGSPTVEFSLIV